LVIRVRLVDTVTHPRDEETNNSTGRDSGETRCDAAAGASKGKKELPNSSVTVDATSAIVPPSDCYTLCDRGKRCPVHLMEVQTVQGKLTGGTGDVTELLCCYVVCT